MCQNFSTTGFWPVGKTMAGETNRWSLTEAGSLAWKYWRPLCGFVVEIAQLSPVPLCVQPLAPVSKPSFRRMLGVVPTAQSPGAATVLKLKTAE